MRLHRHLAASLALSLLIVPLSIGGNGVTVAAASADAPAADARVVAAPGFVEPVSETVAISASGFGRLRVVNVGEGDHVSAGEVIAEIENDDLRAQLASAAADLTQRESELARLQAGARDQERREAEDALHEADVAVWFARLEFGRQSALGEKAVSRAAVDKARADLQTAEARWAALSEKVSLIEAPPRPEDVAIA
ncbi:MAG TPA: biotin/lipoyl-binding protein, partial [Candidatus Kryptonia bacterium]|nr:biotin/lipoyl-binding protein [Candidatus Kryptonia bacterium]